MLNFIRFQIYTENEKKYPRCRVATHPWFCIL